MDDRQLLQEIFEYIRDDSKCTGMHFCIDDHSFMCGLSKKSITDMLKMVRNDNVEEMQLYKIKKNLYVIELDSYSAFYVETTNNIPLNFETTEDEDEEPWYTIRHKFPRNWEDYPAIIFTSYKKPSDKEIIELQVQRYNDNKQGIMKSPTEQEMKQLANKAPKRYMGHKSAPKRKSGLRQLENSVRKMW